MWRQTGDVHLLEDDRCGGAAVGPGAIGNNYRAIARGLHYVPYRHTMHSEPEQTRKGAWGDSPAT
jgi:hypothetical protein